MPHCFVPGCRNSSKKKKHNLSFHSFPKVNGSKWLEVIGRDVNIFIAHERICSDHFKNEDFEQWGALRKIRPNVIPSLRLNLKRNYSEKDVDGSFWQLSTPKLEDNSLSNSSISNEIQSTSTTRRFDEALTLDETLDGTTIRSIDEPSTSKETTSTLTNRNSNKEFTLRSPIRKIRLDHSYTFTPEYFIKQLKYERKRALTYKNKWNISQQTSKRRKKKILSLQTMVNNLKKLQNQH